MNAVAAKARAAAASLECKKDGLRQTQAGEWKLTLTVLDLPAWLMSAKMGTRLMAALVEIGDDEEPVEHATSEVSRAAPRREKKEAAAAVDTNKSSDARDRFRALGKPEQTVVRCARTCADPKFWEFLGVSNEEQAAARVREELGIRSRSELAGDEIAQRIWERMVTDYDLWRQALPEMRG